MGPTETLAHFVTDFPAGTLPAGVNKEARRAVLNWLGCAIGASRHATVERALAALLPFSGPQQASILGRGERTDILTAALINGMSSHTFDFDDTHLKTVIHPAGPVASAILALAEHQPVSGQAFIEAFALGVEVECRVGNCVYPSHYDVGWHITGTTGVFGAAAASGRLLGLDARQATWALGIAATQASGLREMFGTMCKPLHPGAAAKNGLAAALLAQRDFTSSTQAIEAKRGFANVLATERDYAQITARLGETWELLLNTYKPFACGIVIHPVIDGCIQLSKELGLGGEEVAGLELRVHPLVLELTGKTSPKVGLEGKFSVFHCAAVSLRQRDCGEAQFSDQAVNDPATVALRGKVRATVDPAIHEDQAHLTLRLNDGRVVERFVEHAIGSVDRPLTDRDLEEKFRGLCRPLLPAQQIDVLIERCWSLDRAETVAGLAQAATAS